MTYSGEKRKELVGRPQTDAVYLACHHHFWGISVTKGEISGSGREVVPVITCRSASQLDVLKYFSTSEVFLGGTPP